MRVLSLLCIVIFSLHVSARSSYDERLAEIRSRLQRDVELDRARCHRMPWARQYTEMHSLLLVNPLGKVLVAVPTLSGLADRIVGFTTTLLLAILSQRAFQIGRRSELWGMDEVFNQPNIKWARPQDPAWLMEPLAHHAVANQYNQSVLRTGAYYALNTVDNFELQEALVSQDVDTYLGGDARTTMFVTNRGRTIMLAADERYQQRFVDMGLDSLNLFGCLVNFAIQPKEDIFIPVYDQFEKMSSPDPNVLKISVQIRVGDVIWNSAEHESQTDEELLSAHNHFFACAQQIEYFVTAASPDKYSSVVWYLATDSIALRHAAVAHYGDKITTAVDIAVEHSAGGADVCSSEFETDCTVSEESFANAAAEWWMLGYADYHVITAQSGFGRSGAYRTMRADRVYMLDQTPVKCTAESYTKYLELTFGWSGI